MECYIKCPPDKNISLAVGAKSVEFEVERPKTNYDWTRFWTLYIIRYARFLFFDTIDKPNPEKQISTRDV